MLWVSGAAQNMKARMNITYLKRNIEAFDAACDVATKIRRYGDIGSFLK